MAVHQCPSLMLLRLRRAAQVRQVAGGAQVCSPARSSQIAQTCDIMDFGRDLGVMCDVTPLGVILTGCEIMARGCESTHYKTHDINITGPVWHAGTLFSWVRLFRSMSDSWHAYHAWRVLLCAFGARLRVCLGSRGRGRADTRPPSWSVLCGGRGLVACVLMLTHTHTDPKISSLGATGTTAR